MMEVVDIQFYGLPLVVAGRFEAGEEPTNDSPGYPSTFEIHEVAVAGLYDIKEILENSWPYKRDKFSINKIQELEEQIIKTFY